jgi:hypothetical protein
VRGAALPVNRWFVDLGLNSPWGQYGTRADFVRFERRFFAVETVFVVAFTSCHYSIAPSAQVGNKYSVITQIRF